MILLPRRPLRTAEVEELLLGAGFSLGFRGLRGATPSRVLARGEGSAQWLLDPGSDLAVIAADDTPERLEELAKLLDAEPAIDVIARDLRSGSGPAAVRGAARAYGLGTLADASLPRSVIVEALGTWARSETEQARHVVVYAVLGLRWPELAPVADALGEDEALGWVVGRFAQLRVLAEAEELQRAEEQALEARRARLEAAIGAGAWEEALAIARSFEQIDGDGLRSVPYADRPLVLRGRALAAEGLGRRWEAALWAGAWRDDDRRADAAVIERLMSAPLDPAPSPEIDAAVAEICAAVGRHAAAAALCAVAERHTSDEALARHAAAASVAGYALRAEQVSALSALEALAAGHDLAGAWSLLARARLASGDRMGAAAAMERALARSEAPAEGEDAAWAARLAALDGPVTRRGLLSSVRHLFSDDRERVWQAADQELALLDEVGASEEERAPVLRARAIAATFTGRHTEAIRDYQQAIALGHEDDGLMRFNLSCELARAGEPEGAIESLAGAIARDEKWRASAQTDDWLAPLRDDPSFLALIAGTPPTAEDVDAWIHEALGAGYRGEGERAIEASRRAVAGARLLSDPARIARAEGQLGSALTCYGDPEEALAVLAEAASAAREAFASSPVELARILHLQAAGQHAVGQHEPAGALYRESLALREASAEPFEVAITLGDLARLAADSGAAQEAIALQARAREVLERALSEGPPERHLDVLVNLALNEGNRAMSLLGAGRDATEVLDRLDDLVRFARAVADAGGILPPGALPRARSLTGQIVQRGASDEQIARAVSIAEAIAAIEQPDPALREHERWWGMLRFVLRAIAAAEGHDDTTIAVILRDVIRGSPLPEPYASHWLFETLGAELAARLCGPTDLVMVALSLDLAISGARSLDETLEELEAFARFNVPTSS